MVLVVDSDNAHAFTSLPSLASGYTLPLLCLLSAAPAAPRFEMARRATLLAGGGALTLFLHEPLSAICAMCDVRSVTREACAAADEAIAEASHALTRRLVQQLRNGGAATSTPPAARTTSPPPTTPLSAAPSASPGHPSPAAPPHPHPALAFIADPFLRQLLIRFILCTGARASPPRPALAHPRLASRAAPW